MSTVGKRHLHDIKLSLLLLLSLLHSCLLNELTLDNIIELINKQNLTWKAQKSKAIIPKVGGVISAPFTEAKFHKIPIVENLPVNFDAREEWPYCRSLRHIREQKNCGSCWAMSTASVMSDRICIKSKGKVEFEFSAEELITCCDNCRQSNGCEGGVPSLAFKYWIQSGVVSGGDYKSNRGCKPYSYGSYELGVHPFCIQRCTNHKYQISYREDKRYGHQGYIISGRDIQKVQSEIFTNGPVVGIMTPFEDFDVYRGGIYLHKYGKPGLYDHGIKLIGWGVENDVPYWLAANSWGSQWGENGFFKIIKGFNHCGIERVMLAATSDCSSLITHFFLYLPISILYFI